MCSAEAHSHEKRSFKMFRIILSCISELWQLLCESLSYTPTSQTSTVSPSDSMPSTTISQTASSAAASCTLASAASDSVAFSSSQPLSSKVPNSSPTSWDVFLSFRGSDTRYKFTSHLYSALDRHGIRTFMDDPELRRGEVISPALRDAIRKSKTYIVVLSENYASSSWCLDELAEILNCYKKMQRLVIPVFYNIDPSIVRQLTGSFKQAFKKHHVRFVGEVVKVNNWQLTLTEVASFSGYHISEDRSEAGVINEIVDELLLKINPKTLGVAKFPVGLDSRVEAITTLLSNDTEGVIKFGIYGMGGVGKTTLAKALYNQLLEGRGFRGSCFLANVREASGTFKGLESLQQKLINDVLNSTTKVEVDDVEQGINLIRERISSAKVLILIDDIYDLEHYESLAGPLASGSVVIITTRDEEMLDKVSVEPKYRYMLKELDHAQSRELFTQYAFEKTKPTNNLLALCEDILGLAKGLPLALKIFGSYLSIKKEVGWKSYIETLQQYPNSTIEQKLLISLDALELDDRMLKKIFIDIACFFIGWNKKKALKVLKTYYSHVDEKMDTLKKRCLLTVNGKHLEMHDLLRDMGRNVARNKAPDEPGKYSRLWLPEDIGYVLKNHKGTEAIEGIIPHNLYYQYQHQEACEEKSFKWLEFLSFMEEFIESKWIEFFEDLRETEEVQCIIPRKLQKKDALEGESFTMETFKRMSKLRFLYLNNVNLSGSFEQRFEELRWFCWDYCPLKCLPSEFCPQELVVLEFPHSHMRTIWEPHMVSHVFEKLKILNMSSSEDLVTTPDFIKLPRLETLNLKYCKSLEEVHMSIGSLVWLVFLDLHGCVKLKSLPDSICNLRSLEILRINGCVELETLPDQLWKITRLRELDAGFSTLLKKLPDIGPSQIASLSLQELNLSCSGISTLPSGLSQLSNLQSIQLDYCDNMIIIPKLSPSLKQINAYGCKSLERLPKLSNLKQLEELNLLDCDALTEMQGLEELTAIREFHLEELASRLHLTKRLFQMYTEFGHQITICVYAPGWKRPRYWPDWILESPYWTSESKSTTVYAHLLPNESHNFMGIILCFSDPEDYGSSTFGFSVKNTVSGLIWSDSLAVPVPSKSGSLMVVVPKSIFSITDEHHRIELTADNVRFLGIHLLYNTETKRMIDYVVKRHENSVDALRLVDPVLQNIFLDIACFFIGWDKDVVVPILETFYSKVDLAILVLRKRRLLMVSESNKLEMNDLLWHIGRKIARNNSPYEPEKHSRLWLSIDIYEVLKKDKGTEVIEGIVPGLIRHKNGLKGESFTLDAFKKMTKLRFLYLKKVNLTGSFEQTFEDLRWLCWECCPLKFLPFEFYPPKLVFLELPRSNIITMWELNTVPHVFEKLKTLDMLDSQDLITTPDFTKLPCLETLNLRGCESLEEVHMSIGRLVRLVSLDLHGCIKLRSLPDTICNLRALEELDISGCSCLEALPTALGNIQSLKELDAGDLNVLKLPDSIGHLSKLVKLRLSNNKNLETLPNTICNLRSLETLYISGCEKLKTLPDLPTVQTLL